MRFFAIEPDVAAAFGFLSFEDDVALDGDFEAGTDFKGEVGEKGAFGDGFAVDGGEEGG